MYIICLIIDNPTTIFYTFKDQDCLYSDFLIGVLLERVVICIEKAILRLQNDRETPKEFTETVLALAKSLFPSLTRFIMLIQDGVFQTGERKDHPLIFLSIPTLNSASLIQLVLRGMLGCTKFLMASQRLGSSSDSFASNLMDMIDPSNLNRSSVDGGMSFRTGANMDDERELGASSTSRCVQALEELIENNLKLLLAIQERGKYSERDKTPEAPIVVIMIGEFFECIGMLGIRFGDSVVRDPRPRLTDIIVEECKKRFMEPSSILSVALTQLLMLRCPTNPGMV